MKMLDTKRFKEIIDSFYKHLLKTHDEITDIKLAEDKWSLREIIGHLIDSASNNHQRFVRLQFGDLLDFPAYDGEEWIRKQKYNSMNWDVLVALWYNYNCLLLNVVENADESMLQNVWVNNEDAIPLEQLIFGYYKHLELHIEHFSNRQEELLGLMN
jgi:hypothetical protein